jgi:uncharacterized protein (DUF488 family)
VRISLLGYGGSTPTDFSAKIEQMNPDLIVDVRADPHRACLGVCAKSHLQKEYGSRYVWIPELGNKTRDINNIQLVDEEKGLRRLLELARTHDHILLLCAEKKDEDCHRSYVRNRLVRLLSNGSQHLSSNP